MFYPSDLVLRTTAVLPVLRADPSTNGARIVPRVLQVDMSPTTWVLSIYPRGNLPPILADVCVKQEHKYELPSVFCTRDGKF